MAVGQRSPPERIAAPLISLHHRADALGLSLVHTGESWVRLRRAGLFLLECGRFPRLDPR